MTGSDPGSDSGSGSGSIETGTDTDAVAGDTTPLGSYRALRATLQSDRPAAVATVTNVAGSAYRRPGAKLVVSASGDSTGAVTAGCLEDTVADLATAVIDTGEPQTKQFDLTGDTEEVWGMGLGCNGVIDILVEPVDRSFSVAVDELDANRSVVLLTAVASTDPAVGVGDRATLTAAGDRAIPSADDDRATPAAGMGNRANHVARERSGLPDAVLDELASEVDVLRDAGQSAIATVETDDGTVDVFVDTLEPAQDLLLFGGQRDVAPVARFGREVGFRVRVVTGRGGNADPTRFPGAHEVVATRAPDIADVVDAPERTYAVLMSHNFVDDRLALAALLETDIPYVGLMGPRNRFEEMQEAFAEEGEPLDERSLERVGTPVGLDLGGDHPEQIALSVVSEVLAIRNGRAGGRLTDRSGPIHPRVERD